MQKLIIFCVLSVLKFPAPDVIGQIAQTSWKQDDTSDPSFKSRFDEAMRLGKPFQVIFATLSVRLDSSNRLVLTGPTHVGSTGQEGIRVILQPTVVALLQKQDKQDVRSRFQYQAIRAKGRPAWVTDTATFPSTLVRSVVVENLKDIEIIKNQELTLTTTNKIIVTFR